VYEHGALRHPTQLYSAAGALATLAVLIALERRRVLPENGIFYVQGALMCAFRFAVDFVRDVPTIAFGLTTAQLAALAGFAFFAWRFARLAATMRGRRPRGVAVAPFEGAPVRPLSAA
jgi:phosphatidylglycerol:prolipoprotein diacylglycerol transferase